jgi:UDP-2,3-diacylglucosamine pyrophosphatase LpxH
MLYCKSKIDRVYETADKIRLDGNSRIVIMSDCHRGVGSWADDFSKNQLIYFSALMQYNRQKYTYIELGDSDELWENKRFSDIKTIYNNVFWLLRQFHKDNRLYLMFGNHDIRKKHDRHLFDTYYDASKQQETAFLPDIKIHEGLVLRQADTQNEVFLIHGHQTDILNDDLWRLAQFLVRYLWKPLEFLGVNDPTSAAKNNKIKKKVDRRLNDWADERNAIVIAGHTHRPVFPQPGEGRYFNDGSCVHPRCITAIEIVGGSIMLVKWSHKTNTDGIVYIGKDILAGPREINEYFEERKTSAVSM